MAKGKPSISQLKKVGSTYADRYKNKPNFTSLEFKQGIEEFSHNIADDFIAFVNAEFSKGKVDLNSITNTLGVKEIEPSKLLIALEQNDAVVMAIDRKVVEELTYKELIYILEHGRKDEGIPPQPVLKKAFEQFRPIYRQKLKDFLIGKY